MALHLPDFRAGERTFQLLVQVAGRAGRGDVEGEVIVQSFTPYHPAVQFARQHDYLNFYEYEIDKRQDKQMPPLTRMVCITVRSKSEDKARFVADAVARELKKSLTGDHDMMGVPTPAPLAKVQNLYRFQIIFRSDQIMRLTDSVNRVITATKLPDDVNLSVDVDPISLL